MTDTRPIAYLTGDYPKVSHTFILREVESVRAAGVPVITCSIRQPPAAEFKGEEEKRARAETFYVLAAAKNPARLLSAHGRAILRSPGTWVRTLALAIRMRSPGLKALIWQLFYFLEAAVLAEHLRQNSVCHLHNHFGNSSCSVAVLAADLAGIPFSFTEHGPAIFFEVDRWSLPEKIARAAFVVAITHFCRSQLMLFSKPADWPKITIVHCGVTPQAYRRDPGGSGKRVAFVGRLDPVKGALLLIEAMATVLKSHPDATLTLAGDGPARSGAEAKAKDLGIDHAVHFAGFMTQGQVADLLANSDMLVLPSFAEGLPVVYMEALASRIPVVASRVAGVPELVEDGVTGYTIPPGDVDTLANRMIRLMDDPAAARAMGEAGRRAVEAQHDIRTEGAWLAKIFRDGGPAGRLRP
ncbi:MAG: colanic acid biosynthesis glycosyltransferase WcaL [Acetobacteraceae bacterium]|nr:MAG: colanic acid biosynthesis glycosyltransferase WcaL [Acetobacteraceae bacterium]